MGVCCELNFELGYATSCYKVPRYCEIRIYMTLYADQSDPIMKLRLFYIFYLLELLFISYSLFCITSTFCNLFV